MIEIDNNFFRIRLYDRLYYVEHLGSWDDRVTKEYIDVARLLVGKHLYGSPWALMLDLRKWTLNTPDTEKPLKAHFSKAIESGLSCMSIIIQDSDIKRWQTNTILQENMPEKNQFFPDIIKALLWVKQMGFIIPADAFKNSENHKT